MCAHGHEFSGCVLAHADAYNLMLILHRIIMLPGPGPVYTAYDSSNIESGAPF